MYVGSAPTRSSGSLAVRTRVHRPVAPEPDLVNECSDASTCWYWYCELSVLIATWNAEPLPNTYNTYNYIIHL